MVFMVKRLNIYLLLGWYCDVTNLTSPVALCAPGYWCDYGVDTIAPNNNNTGSGGLCPRGYHCPEGSVLPTSCPAGYYQVCTWLIWLFIVNYSLLLLFFIIAWFKVSKSIKVAVCVCARVLLAPFSLYYSFKQLKDLSVHK